VLSAVFNIEVGQTKPREAWQSNPEENEIDEGVPDDIVEAVVHSSPYVR
jgi:hypothetical protein